MTDKTLAQLYAEHAGKVSDKWSLYLSEYDRLFADIRSKPVRLLEIGVQNGGSLEIWSQYFRNAETLLGCDIDPHCADLAYADARIAVVIGDATTPDTSARLLAHCPAFDIVIDDGSHISRDTIRSFMRYFPTLADGGIFIAEDLHCSYWDKFEGGLFDPFSSVAFFKRLVDIINHEHWGISKARTEILNGFLHKYGCEPVAEEFLSQVHSVEFVNSMCIVRKAEAGGNSLGQQIVGGLSETVVPGRKRLHRKAYELDPAFQQSGNPWSARTTPPDEALPLVEEELAAARGEAALLEQQNAELKLQFATALEKQKAQLDGEIAAARQAIQALEQRNADFSTEIASTRQQLQVIQRSNAALSAEIGALRSSTSWRITAPLRLVAAGLTTLLHGLTRGIAVPNVAAATASTATWSGTPTAASPAGELRALLLRRGHLFYRRHLKGTRAGRAIGQQILRLGLVKAADLQISALGQADAAPEATRDADTAYLQIDPSLPGFDITPPLDLEISDALMVRPCINVLLPCLQLKSMSGGPNSALLLAALLAEKGECVRVISCNLPMEADKELLFRHMDAICKRPVARERIDLLDATDRSRPLVIGANDVFLATAWWTAQIAKTAVAKTIHKTFIYLIQDFEPILHEGSTLQARALETYGLPHIPLINTRLLLDHLVKEGVGRYADPAFAAAALCFDPAVDRGYYFPDPCKAARSGKKVMLFYARPTVARRNLFELGVVALRQAVAAGAIDQDSWEVWAMGETLAPVPLGHGLFLNPLPWMGFEDYARRIRSADLLLSLMFSPHPSYPPLEMAASANLVVTNEFSVKTAERLRALSPNILVAEPTVESVAAAIKNAAGRINAGLPSYDPQGSLALPADWDSSLRDVVAALQQRLQALRIAPRALDEALAGGLPAVPKTEYERYRKACLARRRQAGNYRQEAGLLSFVTPAYNTDPVFLRELGNSVFLQDGGMQFEWLILDNGSTDESTRSALRELARHPGVRLERVDHNLGIIGGMRYLLEHAGGRYLLPLDSDDLIEPDCVHVLTRHIEESNYPALLYTDEDKFGAGCFGLPYFKPDWDPVLFLHSCYIAHLCAIDRKQALELDLYSDRASEGCHDWDSFIRFLEAGHTPRHVPEALYSWRIHHSSTAGNIASKSYISDSHRHTLQGFLERSSIPDVDLVNSPLFDHQVDWWFRRRRRNPKTIQSIPLGPASISTAVAATMRELAAAIHRVDSELVNLHWAGVVPDDDEWQWDAMALLELFADAVMVGGLLHDGGKVLGGPMVFGFGSGFDCPDSGRPLADRGYGAGLGKAHSVSAVSAAHCVVRSAFLKRCLAELAEAAVPIEMLGPWLGGLAREMGSRVVYSPFMPARAPGLPEARAPSSAKAGFLSRFWAQVPDRRVYSARLGLEHSKAYSPVSPRDNEAHLARLQTTLLPYPEWLALHLRRRAERYPVTGKPARLTLLTTVYEGTNPELLAALAESVLAQTLLPAQWIIVAHGPLPAAKLASIEDSAAGHWQADLIVEPQALGIMGAMRRGLDSADGDYIVPVDADDLLTADAIRILTSAIARLDQPDLVYSDEDLLTAGQATSPYLRPAFDPVLNLDSSYIWHLCAIKRDTAFALGLYTDAAATWCHDWDSVMRVANAGSRIEHVPEVLYHWRQHAQSTTNNERGDPRSLQSIRHILERQIARSRSPALYQVDDYPIDRGARELYIARVGDRLPGFVWMNDLDAAAGLDAFGDDDILVATDGKVRIEQRSYVEAARLLELHADLSAVGGRVADPDGIVLDACAAATAENPWLGRRLDEAGPYALALKAQTVSATGAALAFFRMGALKSLGPELPPSGAWSPRHIAHLCELLCRNGWRIAFSPLVLGHASAASAPAAGEACERPERLSPPVNGLARYGSTRPFRLQ